MLSFGRYSKLSSLLYSCDNALFSFVASSCCRQYFTSLCYSVLRYTQEHAVLTIWRTCKILQISIEIKLYTTFERWFVRLQYILEAFSLLFQRSNENAPVWWVFFVSFVPSHHISAIFQTLTARQGNLLGAMALAYNTAVCTQTHIRTTVNITTRA